MLALTHCKQSEEDSLSGGYLLVKEFKNDHSEIKNLLKRSDNASVFCGHLTPHVEKMLHNEAGTERSDICISQSETVIYFTGLNLIRRDYSEVQDGKSDCDRMIGSSKMYLKSFGNAGNDILTAHDIKCGFEYCGGPKNVKVAVAEVNSACKNEQKLHIPEISAVRSISYDNDGITIRKASNVGDGKFVPQSNINFVPTMKLVEPFEPQRPSRTGRTTVNSQRMLMISSAHMLIKLPRLF
jgi:hypothetical protein